MRHTTFSGTANFFTTVAAASTAGASACAGGVCALGAQAASAWAASVSTAASMVSVTGASGANYSYPWWQAAALHQPQSLPMLTKAALILLWLSTMYTVISLAGQRRRYAWIAALGALLISISELHWLPGGSPTMIFGITLGISALLLAPWLPRWSPRRCVDRATRIVLFFAPYLALVMVLFMQYADHWPPCPLCLAERVLLILVSLFVLFRKPTTALFFSLAATIPVMLQIIEMTGQSHAAHFLSGVCTALGPSCSASGSKIFVFPVAYDAAGFSVLIFVLSMLNAARAWNSSRAASRAL